VQPCVGYQLRLSFLFIGGVNFVRVGLTGTAPVFTMATGRTAEVALRRRL
jgi:hypothetical protein